MKTAKQIQSAINRATKKLSPQSLSYAEATAAFQKTRNRLENLVDDARYIEDLDVRNEIYDSFDEFLAAGRVWIEECSENYQNVCFARVRLIDEEKRQANARRIWQPL